jgi:hypothetical protein
MAEGLNLAALNSKTALLLAWVFSSTTFGLAHVSNPHASLFSSINLILAGLFLGLGYILNGDLAISIGLHITWSFFQGALFGFTVSGLTQSTTIVAVQQKGTKLWTGGPFGPEAGLLGVLATITGSFAVLLWVRHLQVTCSWKTVLYNPRQRRSEATQIEQRTVRIGILDSADVTLTRISRPCLRHIPRHSPLARPFPSKCIRIYIRFLYLDT